LILLLDIGNTRTKAAFFDKIIQPEAALPKAWTLYDLQQLLRDRPVTGIIVAASGLIPEGVTEWLTTKERTGTRVLFFSHETPIPVQNAYHTPQTLGKDRLAAVIGAWSFYPRRNCSGRGYGNLHDVQPAEFSGYFFRWQYYTRGGDAAQGYASFHGPGCP
jgi:type III pantothenate kinase